MYCQTLWFVSVAINPYNAYNLIIFYLVISIIYAYFANIMKSAATPTYKTIIAIDPDVDRNGVACLDVASRSLDIKALPFPETLDYLHTYASLYSDFYVIIEAGWLNKSNWHLMRYDSKAKAAAKGNAVGRNHEVGRKLAEMCEHWHIPYQLVKPLKKIWQGEDGKITAKELGRLLICHHISFNFSRSNQEQRDACLLTAKYW